MNADLFFNKPWAVAPEVFQQLHALSREPTVPDPAAIAAYRPQAATPTLARRGATAVLPLYGLITQRPTLFSRFFGGTTTEDFSRNLYALLADSGVSTIVIDIASPGGSTDGVEELSAEIYHARTKKRLIAVANSMAASAAYWLGSSASEFVVTPGGMVGSIGVYAIHLDFSAMNARLGVAPTYVSAGKYKVEGNPDTPLNDSARAYLQSVVDEFYGKFVSSVARNRGVSPDTVVNGYGEGRLLTASQAKAAGFVDRVAPLSHVLNGIGQIKARQRTLELLRMTAPRLSPRQQERELTVLTLP